MPTLAPRFRALLSLIMIVGAGAASVPLRAADRAPASATSEAGGGAAGGTSPSGPLVRASGLPPGVELSAEHIATDKKDGSIVAEGAVTITSANGRIQADRITFREGHIVQADGNVLVVWGENRISGTSMLYDMGIKDDPDPKKRIARGVIQNAIGQVQSEYDFFFEARRVDTIGQDRVVLHHATVTTCTQPVPYWSFAVSTAKIKAEGYAHMFNVRPKIGKMPIFYLPYLAWPVKTKRAVGLLFPEFGTTTNYGRVVSVPLFVPMGPSADVTLFGEYYTVGSWGGGAKFRVRPNRDGYAEIAGHYVDDRVEGRGRYQVQVQQNQSFLNGFRMVSDVDIVSDFNYYTDFVRNLTYASSPTILGRVAFTRNGSWTSLFVQEQYREQLFGDGTTLLQTTYPQIQWRGRSKKLGKSPLYFSYLSSAYRIGQNGPSIDAAYWRADLAPTLSLPLAPAPWIDITPTLSVRSTYWSQHLEPAVVTDPTAPIPPPTVVDGGLMRNLLGASIDVSGPRFYRIFEKETKDGKRKTKNTIEPTIVYNYQQAFDRRSQIITYDDVDTFGSNANSVTYGVTSRVIAQRPRAPEAPAGDSGERILVPDSASGQLREATSGTADESAGAPAVPGAPNLGSTSGGTAPPGGKTPLEPVEVGSISATETYSFNAFPSNADIDGDCIRYPVVPPNCLERSHLSTVSLTGRYNPAQTLSFDLSSQYDVLFDTVGQVSLSGNFRQKLATGLFSVVYRAGLGYQRKIDPDTGLQACEKYSDVDPTMCVRYAIEPKANSTQVRFQGNFGPFASRLRLGMDFTGNVRPAPGAARIPYQRWRVEYYTQCCGFLAEYLVNDYTAFRRKEFRFAIDLRGIGKLFDLNQGIP